jgi:hypothetical protein
MNKTCSLKIKRVLTSTHKLKDHTKIVSNFQTELMSRQVEFENLYEDARREREQLLEQNKRVRKIFVLEKHIDHKLSIEGLHAPSRSWCHSPVRLDFLILFGIRCNQNGVKRL